jgi:phage gp16-like protein
MNMASTRNRKWNKKQATAEDRRRAELAKIHIAKAEKGLSEDDYRLMLKNVAGVDSAADLDAKARRAVLDHLCGGDGRSKQRPYPGKPRNMEVPERAALLDKIEAFLSDRGLPWAYAAAMAKRMCKKDALELCGPEDLMKIVQAFAYDARRKGLRT